RTTNKMKMPFRDITAGSRTTTTTTYKEMIAKPMQTRMRPGPYLNVMCVSRLYTPSLLFPAAELATARGADGLALERVQPTRREWHPVRRQRRWQRDIGRRQRQLLARDPSQTSD